jgi:hypothetical protein
MKKIFIMLLVFFILGEWRDIKAQVIFEEHFNNLECWTPVGPQGYTNWSISNGWLKFSGLPSFSGTSRLLSCKLYSTAGHNHQYDFMHMCDWYSDPAPALGIAITYDSGLTHSIQWQFTPVGGNVGPEPITGQFIAASDTFRIIFFMTGISSNIDAWYIDYLLVTDLDWVPVELIAFTCEVNDNIVTLFWQTATETNNSGFEIERAPSKSPPKGETSGWGRIGFVEGKGTTTEIQSYSFTDKPEPGKYKYRLKQIDFDGTFACSPEVEAEVKSPNVFSLEQNYPNLVESGSSELRLPERADSPESDDRLIQQPVFSMQ